MNSKPDLVTVKEGQYCGTQFSLDKQWYRGRVVSVDNVNKIFRVQFVDFGNEESKKLEDMRYLDEALLQHPAQVILQPYTLNLKVLSRIVADD